MWDKQHRKHQRLSGMTSRTLSGIRGGGLFVAFACLLWAVAAASAADISAGLEHLLATSRTDEQVSVSLGTSEPRVRVKADGFVGFLSSAPGEYFRHEIEGDEVKPEDVALDFVQTHAPVFGLLSADSALEIKRVTTNKRLEYVRLQQSYRGIPVLGAEMMVHVIDRDGVNAVMSDIMRNTAALDADSHSTVPSLPWNEAVEIAIQSTAKAYGVSPTVLEVSGDPELVVYDPAVVKGQEGGPVMTWKMRVHAHGLLVIDDDVFVDAHSGNLALRVYNVCGALDRKVYNGFNILPYGILAREEGDPAHGVAEVNQLYDHMGATYGYYSSVHGRDSYDDSGSPIRGTIRSAFSGAYWWLPFERMTFSQGWAVDDVVAHEFTHGVTQFESGLLSTASESGALSESISDIWGEFIDLSYGTNTDPWELGEDLPGGTLRYMDEPHSGSHPDRYEGTYWDFTLSDYYANGGVNRKLAHLLAAGDSSFYGSSYSPLDADLQTSMLATIKLYYEVQTNRLTSSSDYADLGDQLVDAGIDAALFVIDLGNDINWNAVALQRVINAFNAVQI